MNLRFLEQIRNDFPQFLFEEGDDFVWSAAKNTVFFTNSSEFELLLLHELSHALLGHKNFELDIELLQIETAAWQKTVELAAQYSVNFDENSAQQKLDTYRDWLHKRSLCPNCFINGFQQNDLSYKCPACGTIWHANDSRFKNLRRIKK